MKDHYDCMNCGARRAVSFERGANPQTVDYCRACGAEWLMIQMPGDWPQRLEYERMASNARTARDNW